MPDSGVLRTREAMPEVSTETPLDCITLRAAAGFPMWLHAIPTWITEAIAFLKELTWFKR